MQWLIISSNNEAIEKVKSLLTSKNPENELLVCNFDSSELAAIKKTFTTLAACIIYNENEIPETELTSLCCVSGYLVANKIPVITNIPVLYNSPLLDQGEITTTKTLFELSSYLDSNINFLHGAAIQRCSKKDLFEKGIPYTSDCFATYIAKNKEEIIKKFLTAGMSVNSRDDDGTPMLNIACRNDNFEIAEMLLDLGAQINAESEDRGYTAVMDAVWRGNEKLTKFLISKGADLNTINKEGQTNLILAVGADRTNIVELLAKNGADPDIKDRMGMSAYTYASLFRKTKIAEILKPFHKEN